MATTQEKTIAWEGCISEDEQILLVERPSFIQVNFHSLEQALKAVGTEVDDDGQLLVLDKKGRVIEPTTVSLKGLMCRIFQHEIDHLDGRVMWNEANRDDFKVFDSKSTDILGDNEGFEAWFEQNEQYLLSE